MTNYRLLEIVAANFELTLRDSHWRVGAQYYGIRCQGATSLYVKAEPLCLVSVSGAEAGAADLTDFLIGISLRHTERCMSAGIEKVFSVDSVAAVSLGDSRDTD